MGGKGYFLRPKRDQKSHPKVNSLYLGNKDMGRGITKQRKRKTTKDPPRKTRPQCNQKTGKSSGRSASEGTGGGQTVLKKEQITM